MSNNNNNNKYYQFSYKPVEILGGEVFVYYNSNKDYILEEELKSINRDVVIVSKRIQSIGGDSFILTGHGNIFTSYSNNNFSLSSLISHLNMYSYFYLGRVNTIPNVNNALQLIRAGENLDLQKINTCGGAVDELDDREEIKRVWGF
jgi:hypothetical protein